MANKNQIKGDRGTGRLSRLPLLEPARAEHTNRASSDIRAENKGSVHRTRARADYRSLQTPKTWSETLSRSVFRGYGFPGLAVIQRKRINGKSRPPSGPGNNVIESHLSRPFSTRLITKTRWIRLSARKYIYHLPVLDDRWRRYARAAKAKRMRFLLIRCRVLLLFIVTPANEYCQYL